MGWTEEAPCYSWILDIASSVSPSVSLSVGMEKTMDGLALWVKPYVAKQLTEGVGLVPLALNAKF